MDEMSGFHDRRRMVKRTVLASDFDFKNEEFSSAAVANRRLRRRRVTPLMKWQFAHEMLRMMATIRNMRPSIDNRPPETPSISVMHRNRQQGEENEIHVNLRSNKSALLITISGQPGRLRVIETENHEMLQRLRNIDNRPRSYFCHLKKRGVPLVKGDAYRLRPPKKRGGYLLQMYRKCQLANPVLARKSIRIQKEMLEDAIHLVEKSNMNKPSEELIDSVVQMKLATVDEVPSPDTAGSGGEEQLSPVELVQIANPIPEPQAPDAQKIFDELLGIPTTQTTPSDAGSEISEKKS